MSTRPGTGPRSFRRRATALLGAFGLVAALSIAQGTGTTEAAWQDREHARAAGFTAGLATPTSNGACAISFGSLTASWNASGRASAVPITYSYQILFPNGAVAVGPTSVGSSTSLTRSLGLLSLGTYTLEIRATSPGLQSAPLRAQLALLTSLAGTCTWM